jgi:hypothetical protein
MCSWRVDLLLRSLLDDPFIGVEAEKVCRRLYVRSPAPPRPLIFALSMGC